MPSGVRIDWPQYDNVIRQHLPSMTVEVFTKTYLPGFSSKAVGARARKLGVSPAVYHPTPEHKAKIAATHSRQWSPQDDAYLLANYRTVSLKQFEQHLGVDATAIWRRLHELGVEQTPADSHAKWVAATGRG